MSHTRNSVGDASTGPNRAYFQLSRMMREGRSWSGYERNCVFLNTRDGRFATASAVSGFDFADDARAIALTDWDQDGDLDLWVSNRNAPRLRFLRNNAARGGESAGGGGGGRFLALLLEGSGAGTNRDAIGARVEVVMAGGDPGKLIRSLRAGEGFLAQSSKWLHFGLGSAGAIVKVAVRWPGGGVEEFTGIEAGKRYRLAQGSGRGEEVRRPGAAALPAAAPQQPLETSAKARIPIAVPLRVPAMEYIGFDGARSELPVGRGRPLLINLFASWCAPCAEELGELARRAPDVRAGGIEVVALAVDGLGDDRTGPEAARDLIERLHFPFTAGRATAPLLHLFQYLHDAAIPLYRPLPLPASFLVDGAGRLAVIVKGRLRVDDLIADAALPAVERAARWERAALFPGQILGHPLAEAARIRAEARTRFQYAADLSRGGRPGDAIAEYLELLEIKPDFAEAHLNLALLYLGRKEPDAAERHCRLAIGLQPGLAEAHFNLARVLEAKGDASAAAAAYQRALDLRPGYPGANNALGLLLAQAGRLEPAAARFAEEIRLHPDLAEAHNHLGLVHLQSGREAEARACFERAIRLAPDLADAHNNLGIALRRQGEIAAAEAAYRRAIRARSDFAEAHNNLGLVLLQQGKDEEAARHFERALEIDPAFEPARANLQRLEK